MVSTRLVNQDRCSWSSLITESIRGGKVQHALALYKKASVDNHTISLDGPTYVGLLKACALLQDIDSGQQLHQSISTTCLLEKDVYIGSSLVNMYGKCNLLSKAQEVFDKLPSRNVVSWTALMTGYQEYGHSEEALHHFERMQAERILPNTCSYLCILKACSCLKDADMGRCVHLEIVKRGLELEELLGNTLVDTYAKCGSLASAQKIFNSLLCQDVVSWTALMAGYVECNNAEEALSYSERMDKTGILFNSHTFVCLLKACASACAMLKGQELHSRICSMGVENELLVGSALVNMYAKCALLPEAEDVFNKLPRHDGVLWTTLIGGHVEHGCGEKAIHIFRKMQTEGYSLIAATLICGVKACSSLGDTIAGQELHSEVIKKGFEGESFMGTTLVDMYAKCGLLAMAREVLDKLALQDRATWNALLAGYADYGLDEEALRSLKQMQVNGIALDAASLVCGLKACSHIRDVVSGHSLHSKILSAGLEREVVVGSTVLDMYMKCGSFAEAQVVFDELSSRDVVAWTALITGFTDHGHGKEGLQAFKQMQEEGIHANTVTFSCSLKACSCEGAIDKGKEIHGLIAKRGLEREPFVAHTLVDMYAKCGMLVEAQEVFKSLSNRDVVAGTALITGYTDHGYGEEALRCFDQLQHEGIPLNSVAFVCSFRACGQLGAFNKGQQLHDELVRKGFDEELMVKINLVDMYAKCASVNDAQYTFDKLTIRDVVDWNALIAGYAQAVEMKNVIYGFESMIEDGVWPSSATIASVLNSCGDAGLVGMAQMFWAFMSNEYDFLGSPDHYACLVDLLGRVGQIDKAVAVIEYMPFHPHAVLWHTVLGACRKMGNLELGRFAFEHAASLDQTCIAAYVQICNIYAGAALEEV